jgi:hypothetical protein
VTLPGDKKYNLRDYHDVDDIPLAGVFKKSVLTRLPLVRSRRNHKPNRSWANCYLVCGYKQQGFESKVKDPGNS